MKRRDEIKSEAEAKKKQIAQLSKLCNGKVFHIRISNVGQDFGDTITAKGYIVELNHTIEIDLTYINP